MSLDDAAEHAASASEEVLTENLAENARIDDARPAATPREVRRAIAGILMALSLASLDGNIVGPALPRIASDLGGLSHLAWVVTAFAVASTAAIPLYGKLSDQYGRRPAFFVSIGLFLLGSMLCGAARSMPELIAARALQGVGAGGLITLSQTAIADLVSPRERGRYQGMVPAVFAMCSIAGPLLGGVITDYLSWPWIFYINVPVGVVALAILATSLRPQASRRSRGIDLPGFGLLIGGTCTGLLALSWGGVEYPWVSAPVLGLIAATFVLFGVLVPVERVAAEPALPPRLFRNAVFVRGVAALSLNVMAMFGSLVFIPLFFQLVLGASATEAGLRLAPTMGGMIVGSVVGGRLVTRTGRYKKFPLIGLALGTFAYAGMGLAARFGGGANLFDVYLTFLGVGLGLVMPNITTAVQNAVAIGDLGVATATLGFFRSLGGAFGVAIAGTILSGTLRSWLPATVAPGLVNLGLAQLRTLAPGVRAELMSAYGHALGFTFGAAAVCTSLAFMIIVFIPELPLRGREPGRT